MDLHRVEGKPDWAGLKPEQLNRWQKVARRSGGILTIGNYFSLLGLLSVPYGLLLILDGRYLAGVVVLLLGRFCDMLDGYLADKTGTKSPLGEKVDAVFDKLSTGLALFVLALSGLLPPWAVALLVLPHAVVAVMAVRIYFARAVLHPSRSGKLSMAAGWIAMLAFVAVHALDGVPRTFMAIGAYGVLAISVVLGIVATIGYYRVFRKLESK